MTLSSAFHGVTEKVHLTPWNCRRESQSYESQSYESLSTQLDQLAMLAETPPYGGVASVEGMSKNWRS